jgi:hypothetical protein
MESIRHEIAIAAARLIVEDGMEYGAAKRKAAKMLFGKSGLPAGTILPDNGEVEEEVRAYQALFQEEEQPARIRALRQAALEAMQELAAFRPYLVGPVLTGTATAYSDIHLQLFCDSAKEVEIFFLNRGVDFDVDETPHFRGKGKVESVRFEHDGHTVCAAVYSPLDLRGAPRQSEPGEVVRADAKALSALLAADA